MGLDIKKMMKKSVIADNKLLHFIVPLKPGDDRR